MGKLKHFIALLLTLASLSLQAQMTYVKGTARGGEGKRILVKTMDDYISGREKLLASALIDSNSFFSMEFPLKETIYAWFEVEYYEGEMYLDPGTHHQFTLRGLVFNDQTDKINGNLEPLVFSVVPDSTDVLNQRIRRFNRMTNQVLINHMDNLMGSRFKKSLDSLKVVCDSVFSGNSKTFFTEYVWFRFASLYQMNTQSSGNGLFFTYLYHKPVLYSNIEYMAFFRQFYGNYFSVANRPFGVDRLRYMVNTGASFPAILDSLGADTLLQNEVLREMVLLETLNNIKDAKGYNKGNIKNILREFSLTSKFENHRRIAANILEVSSQFKEGSKAPDFALQDGNGDTVRLSGFLGKAVYLHFFTTWNVASLEEMEVMRSLHSKYGQSIQFISICCDREYMKMFHFARDSKYSWPLLHFNNDYALLKSLGVKTYPYFILIDGKGCYIKNPSVSPSGNIESDFKKLLGVE